jgi:hypothetical protein
MSDMKRSGFNDGRAQNRSWRVAALIAAHLASGCLVTRDVNYDQPAIPAQVERAGARPAEFEQAPNEPDEACLGEREGNYMRFAVQVNDLNVEEELEVIILVNGRFVRGLENIPPNDHQEPRKEVSFCLDESVLPRACNFVQVNVSARFRDTSVPLESPYDDISETHWWVIGNAPDNPYASYIDCQDALPDGGMP